MGMFYYVKTEYGDKCPYCEESIKEWQSKDDIGGWHNVWGGCCERHPEPLPLLEKKEVENFYTHCDKCGKWIEHENKNGHYLLIKENKNNE